MLFAGLFAKLAANAVLGRAAANARADFAAIPPKVKLYAAIAIGLLGLFFIHQHVAHKAIAGARAAGYAAAKSEDKAAADKIAAHALAVKHQVDELHAAIVHQERVHYDNQAASNRALAAALRLRVQQHAQVQSGSYPGTDLPGAPGAPGAAGGSQARADAGMAEPTATVSANQLIDYAEQCDDDHAARITIEDAWARLKATWLTPKGTTNGK
jgi:hypothetical protein